jgi:hypothetical protein
MKVRETVGDYDPDTELAEDYDYWIRISKKFSMEHLSEPLYFHRIHSNSLYVSKYHEVKVVDFLVRVKDNILNIEHATKQFIDFIIEKNLIPRSKPLSLVFLFIHLVTFKRIRISTLYKIFYRVLFSNRVGIILRDFKMNIINIDKAKSKLLHIINWELI